MKLALAVVLFLVVVSFAFAQPVINISSTRDTNGKFDQWTEQIVAWETEVIADVPDHKATDDDVLQEWYIPVEGGYQKCSFTRAIKGEYGFRYSNDGQLWSEVVVVEIVKPKKPKHND